MFKTNPLGNDMNGNTAFCSVPEMLLMLRAPGAGRLATLLTALDEASRDPDFNTYHQAILAHCLDERTVPAAVAEAARQRTHRQRIPHPDTPAPGPVRRAGGIIAT